MRVWWCVKDERREKGRKGKRESKKQRYTVTLECYTYAKKCFSLAHNELHYQTKWYVNTKYC